MIKQKTHFLIGTRWFGVLGPCSQLIEELASAGYEIFVFGQSDSHYKRYYKGNCKLVKLHMKRSYVSFYHDILDLLKLTYFIRKYQPVGIHSFNPKPSLISGAPCFLFPRLKFFVGVTGLGNTFIRAPRLKRYIVYLLRRVCRRADFVFFQNPDDVELFRAEKIVDESKIKLFIGPGVDLDLFASHGAQPPFASKDKIVVLTMARLIWQKGIKEYVEAARSIAQSEHNGKIEFRILGEYDFDHPDCVDPKFIEAAVKDGVISHFPWTDDVPTMLREADIFVLHSYREGAPRAILEASACRLPTIGSDAIGVRELVINNVTGILTPLKDVVALKDAILRLADDEPLRKTMGSAAFEKIAKPFSLKRSTEAQLQMYHECNYF